MEFETVFEYRHKKFGKRNRSADGENDLALNLNHQAPFDPSPPKRSRIEIAPGSIQFIAEVQLEPVNLSPRNRFTSLSTREMEVIDLSIDSQTMTPDAAISAQKKEAVTRFRATSTPNSTAESISPVELHSDEVQVKDEPVTPQPSRISTRRKGRSSSHSTKAQANNRDAREISISSSASSDLIAVKIKEELIEINTTIKEKIPEETFEDICRFHENMVRRFPKKDRSPKEQDRRNKNTVACRKSRRVRKLSAALEETEYKNKHALYKDQMREYFILEKYSQFIMALAKTETTVIVVD